MTVKNKNSEIITSFEVVDYNDLTILGLADCVKMNYSMLQINEYIIMLKIMKYF